jgi:hypothetical protein
MGKANNEGQALTITASLAVDTAWDQLPTEILQSFIELSPTERGVRFTAFLKNGGRVVIGGSQTLPIDRTKPFNPAEFISQGWTIWRGPKDGNGLEGEEEQDARSLALTELDLDRILLEAHLKNGETSTTGEERIKRLNAANRIKLDAKAFQTLWESRHELPERFKQKTNGNTTFIFCDGTVLRSPDGHRFTLYFCWNAVNRKWNWYYLWLGSDRGVNNPSACLAS